MEPISSVVGTTMAILSGLGGVLFFYIKRFNGRLEDIERTKATKAEVRELISLNMTPIEVELREIKDDIKDIKKDIHEMKR